MKPIWTETTKSNGLEITLSYFGNDVFNLEIKDSVNRYISTGAKLTQTQVTEIAQALDFPIYAREMEVLQDSHDFTRF